MTEPWHDSILTNAAPVSLDGDAPVTNPRDIASWTEANVVLSAKGEPDGCASPATSGASWRLCPSRG